MAAKNANFLDTSFLFYSLDRGVPFKEILSRLRAVGEFSVNVKTLQELVYRYHLLGETAIGYENAMLLRNAAKVLPVTKADLLQMDLWLDQFPNLSPRELLHLANMKNNGISSVVCGPKSKFREFPAIEVRNLLAEVIPNL